MHVFNRLHNLVRGMLARWIGTREQEHPEAVYEAAIQERLSRYRSLRDAAAAVLYARTKLATELQMKSSELSRLGRQLDAALEYEDDDAALALIGRRDGLRGEVERLTVELTELTSEADAAKKNLIGFQREIAQLRDEKVRMIARLANAKARLRLHETLNGLSADADIRALEAVRDHINQLVATVQLGRAASDPELERRLGKIRDAEAVAAARAQLDELKRSRRRILLPVVLSPKASSA